MASRLTLLMAGSLLLLTAAACARGGAGEGVVAIALNREAGALPRLAFYVGAPGRDQFYLPAGRYDLIAMDIAGGLATRRGVAGGEDLAHSVLSTLEFEAATESAGRRMRAAMGNLLLFFARFDEVQLRLEVLLTRGKTEPPPASPDELSAAQILGTGGQRPVRGIGAWETEMGSWGRTLELGVGALGPQLSCRCLAGPGSPFADAEALVREWRDGAAADHRAFLEVLRELSDARRAALYGEIAAVFEVAISAGPADFYRRVAAGELDSDMWAIANFAYENDRPDSGGGPSYLEIARSEGREPGRPYYDRWLRQSASAWGFVWSVSAETAGRAMLPAEVIAAGERGEAVREGGAAGGPAVEAP